MLRPIPLTNYLGTLTSLGFDTRDLLANTPIDPAGMVNPRYLVRFGQYFRFFENAARVSSYPGLGLEFGLRSSLEASGVLGYATVSCRSARQSMEDLWARHGASLGMMATPRFVDEAPTTVTVQFSVASMSEAAYRLCIEEALCRIASTGTALVGSQAAFEQIMLSYPAPAYSERYGRIFRCPVEFNAPATSAVIKRDWIERPLKTRDDRLLGVYLRQLGRIDRQIRDSTSIVDMAAESLLRGENKTLRSQAEVAESLGLSVRTLCRRLHQQGSSYRRLAEQVRIERVLASLDLSQASAVEIACQAGYRNLSAFRRAFKKWTRHTVGQYQQNMTGAAAPSCLP